MMERISSNKLFNFLHSNTIIFSKILVQFLTIKEFLQFDQAMTNHVIRHKINWNALKREVVGPRYQYDIITTPKDIMNIINLRNNRIAMTTLGRLILIWNTNTFQIEQTLEHSDTIFFMKELANNQLVSSCRDGQCYIWNLNDSSDSCPQHLFVIASGFSGLLRRANQLSFSDNEYTLVTLSTDLILRVWTITESDVRFDRVVQHEIREYSLWNGYLLIASANKSIQLLDPSDNYSCKQTISLPDLGHVDYFDVLPAVKHQDHLDHHHDHHHHDRLVSCDKFYSNHNGNVSYHIRIWKMNPETHEITCLRQISTKEQVDRCYHLHPDDSDDTDRFASVSSLQLMIWKGIDEYSVNTLSLSGKKDSITTMIVLPNGRIVTSSERHLLVVWDIHRMECSWIARGEHYSKHRMGIMLPLPDGRFLTSSGDCHLFIWKEIS